MFEFGRILIEQWINRIDLLLGEKHKNTRWPATRIQYSIGGIDWSVPIGREKFANKHASIANNPFWAFA